MIILGLDISTVTIGFSIVENEKILDLGFIDIKKYKTIKEKVIYTYETLQELKYFNDIEYIIVEDSLSGFARGMTSMQTIIKLSKINGVLCFLIEWMTNIQIELVNPNTLRKTVFGKARIKGVKSKEYVKMKIEEMYDTSEWIKYTSRKNWDKRNIDGYDALVAALYYNKK